MHKEKPEVKTFNMLMKKDMWMFLKAAAASQERSMTEIVNTCLDKYRKSIERKEAKV